MDKDSSKKEDRIYLEFKTFFKQVKARSELKSRSMPNERVEEFIITDTDEPTLKVFYEDAVSDIAERLGVIDRLQDYGGTAIYKLTELQTEQKMKRTGTLLERVFVNYLLFQWYHSVGLDDHATEYLQFYQEYLRQYRTNSTQPGFVKPKHTPYW